MVAVILPSVDHPDPDSPEPPDLSPSSLVKPSSPPPSRAPPWPDLPSRSSLLFFLPTDLPLLFLSEPPPSPLHPPPSHFPKLSLLSILPSASPLSLLVASSSGFTTSSFLMVGFSCLQPQFLLSSPLVTFFLVSTLYPENPPPSELPEPPDLPPSPLATYPFLLLSPSSTLSSSPPPPPLLSSLPILFESCSPALPPPLTSLPYIRSSLPGWCETSPSETSTVNPSHNLPAYPLAPSCSSQVIWQVSNLLLRWNFVPNTIIPSCLSVFLDGFITAGCSSLTAVCRLYSIFMGFHALCLASPWWLLLTNSWYPANVVSLDNVCLLFPNVSLILSDWEIQDSPVLQGFSSRFIVSPAFVAGFFSALVADISSVFSTESNALASVSDAVDQKALGILVFFDSSCSLSIKCIYFYLMFVAICLAKLWALTALYLVITPPLMEFEFY